MTLTELKKLHIAARLAEGDPDENGRAELDWCNGVNEYFDGLLDVPYDDRWSEIRTGMIEIINYVFDAELHEDSYISDVIGSALMAMEDRKKVLNS